MTRSKTITAALLALTVVLLASVNHGRQVFRPSTSAAGLQVECAALPDTPVNGDVACDSGASSVVKVRSNGAWVEAGGGSAGTAFQEFPFDGSATISSSAQPMAVADRVYVQRIKFDRTLTSPTAWYFSVATGSASSTWYWGLYSTDGNTRVINCSGSGASAVTITCSTGLATVTAGDYFMAYAASNTVTACAVTANPGTGLSESAKMRGYATNTVSGASLPTTLGAITYTGANQMPPCKSILATF